MLNIALSSIRTLLETVEIDGEVLIEKYGNLVFPVSIPESIGQTENGQEILKDRVFPVSCGVSFQDCITNQRYQELSPNSRYKSIAYWEQLSDATMNTSEAKFAPKGGLVVYDIPVRFVFWGSMAKLNINGTGATECSFVAPIALKIINTLYRRPGFEIADAQYGGAKVEFVFAGQESKDPAKVFGRYSYGKELAKFLFSPFDFFSLKYLVRLRINRNCVDAFTFGTPNLCPVVGTAES